MNRLSLSSRNQKINRIIVINWLKIVVYCPESRNATATQHPFRRSLDAESNEYAEVRTKKQPAPIAVNPPVEEIKFLQPESIPNNVQ